MSRDFIAILTPPAETFPDISVGDPDQRDSSKPEEYDYYSLSSLSVAPDLSVPDFLITADTKELRGIIYRFELKDRCRLRWVTSTLDQKTFGIWQPCV